MYNDNLLEKRCRLAENIVAYPQSPSAPYIDQKQALAGKKEVTKTTDRNCLVRAELYDSDSYLQKGSDDMTDTEVIEQVGKGKTETTKKCETPQKTRECRGELGYDTLQSNFPTDIYPSLFLYDV